MKTIYDFCEWQLHFSKTTVMAKMVETQRAIRHLIG